MKSNAEEDRVDEIVIAQADDDAAWSEPIIVKLTVSTIPPKIKALLKKNSED